MVLAEQIRTMRQKLFMSQEALANELNVSLATVNRWETGKSRPNLVTMKQIKAFCDKHGVNYEPLEESWLIKDRHTEPVSSGGKTDASQE